MENSDNFMSSHSKKKIFFQYDQYSGNKITKQQFETIEDALKSDIVVNKIMNHIHPTKKQE